MSEAFDAPDLVTLAVSPAFDHTNTLTIAFQTNKENVRDAFKLDHFADRGEYRLWQSREVNEGFRTRWQSVNDATAATIAECVDQLCRDDHLIHKARLMKRLEKFAVA